VTQVGFDSVVVVVGSADSWNSDPLYHFVLSALRQLDAVIVFLEPRPEKSVMISQVANAGVFDRKFKKNVLLLIN